MQLHGLGGFPGGSEVKNLPAKQKVQSLGQEDPLKKEWQRTPVSLPGKPHGQRSLAGCSHGVTKESDMTETKQQQHGLEKPLTFPKSRALLLESGDNIVVGYYERYMKIIYVYIYIYMYFM